MRKKLLTFLVFSEKIIIFVVEIKTNIMTIEEAAALRIHERAITAGDEYAASHGQSIIENVAYARGYKKGYMTGSVEMYEKACAWLRDRVNIPYDVETNEDGEPMADSYIDYAKKRLEAAEEIISEFTKAMEE